MTIEERPGDGPDPDEGVVERVLEAGDDGVRKVRRSLSRVTPGFVVRAWTAAGRLINRMLPKGLLGRSMLIIMVPMVILQSVVGYVFLDRHWQLVTGRLSASVVRDIGFVLDLVEAEPSAAEAAPVIAAAEERFDYRFELLGDGELPGLKRRSVFNILDRTLRDEIRRQIDRPFWVDTVGQSDFVEIRIESRFGILRVLVDRSEAYASNSHIFLVWMVSTAIVLILLSLIFIRNQIRPIQRLANAAESFGKGRPVGDFAPQGAREVRRAALAFIEMRRRIERQIEQRTTMLAGVSHDLRTVLTRFRLELALMPESEDTDAMRRDVDEMEAMLEAYLAFAKGDPDEASQTVDLQELLADVAGRARNRPVALKFVGDPRVEVRPGAFRRLIGNLLGNAVRHGTTVNLTAEHHGGWLTVTVDDDGPGVPEEEREAVFRPFYRLDEARNQDTAGTGLGLAIARDIARSHGGDIRLDKSPLGGLRAAVRIPG
ncbi:ATP-binding protein [Chthonobacter albigriseus]|uniref:ATP-binding protein n=1 Tax=Chthonobacter albigriseus TaxID=1683161 RepID=UPI0015EFC651|nr:ATP-binding protein [Chthonobacter albigriseus]